MRRGERQEREVLVRGVCLRVIGVIWRNSQNIIVKKRFSCKRVAEKILDRYFRRLARRVGRADENDYRDRGKLGECSTSTKKDRKKKRVNVSLASAARSGNYNITTYHVRDEGGRGGLGKCFDNDECPLEVIRSYLPTYLPTSTYSLISKTFFAFKLYFLRSRVGVTFFPQGVNFEYFQNTINPVKRKRPPEAVRGGALGKGASGRRTNGKMNRKK